MKVKLIFVALFGTVALGAMAVAYSASPFSAALTKGASLNLRLLVVDEQGGPVEGSVVDCRLGMLDESESRSVRVKVDERGYALIEEVIAKPRR